MRTIFGPFLLALAFVAPAGFAGADDSPELRKQRQDAQRERQQQVLARNKEVNEANRAFRAYTHDLKMEYREQERDLDTQFKLREVDLKADHDARVAGAEADYQKKLMSLFMNPGGEITDQAVQQMRAEAKAFSDALFDLKRQSAEELHKAFIANEQSKHELLSERDELVLDEAASLGLTHKYSPILATPIGDGLTAQEQRWNDKETRDVARLEERNSKALLSVAAPTAVHVRPPSVEYSWPAWPRSSRAGRSSRCPARPWRWCCGNWPARPAPGWNWVCPRALAGWRCALLPAPLPISRCLPFCRCTAMAKR